MSRMKSAGERGVIERGGESGPRRHSYLQDPGDPRHVLHGLIEEHKVHHDVGFVVFLLARDHVQAITRSQWAERIMFGREVLARTCPVPTIKVKCLKSSSTRQGAT